MKNVMLLFIAFVLFHYMYAQQDPAAKAILDELSANTKKYTTLQADIALHYESLQDGSTFDRKGKIKIKGEKYVIDFSETITYFDGKNIWTFLPDDGEVTITEPDESDDNVFLSNPVKLFSIYNENFKYLLRDEVVKDGKKYFEIDLFPIDLNKSYSRIRLHIDKNKSFIYMAKVFEKMGDRYTISVRNIQTNLPLKDDVFAFDRKKHPDVEVVDMRF